MREITNDNFKATLPEIEQLLKDALFISIDAEFTGIQKDNALQNSLFDTLEERYRASKDNIKPFIIVQFGITTFQRIPDTDKYEAKPFVFYLLPRSIPKMNRLISWQMGAVEFLSSYKFDFNKVIYKGIPYLNESDEAALKEQIDKGTLLQNIQEELSYNHEDEIKECYKKVFVWLKSPGTDSDSLTLEASSPMLQYLIHKELRRRFLNIWTISGQNSIIVIKVRINARKQLIEKEGNILEMALLNSCIGFSQVFKLLINVKKPIVGHNLFLDLMFMHQQFYKPIPNDYADFKKNIHELFPEIYDTKHLSFELKDLLKKDGKNVKWKENSLGTLYKHFKSVTQYASVNEPQITTGENITTDEIRCHHAGFDAFYTGYIFLKMSYIFAAKEHGINTNYNRPLSNAEVRSSLNKHLNCLNMIRGYTTYTRLDGSDPVSQRPPWLYVKFLKTKNINVAQVANKFSAFGAVDVKPLTSRGALVAVGNYGCAQDILMHFRSCDDLYVTPYNPFRHSPTVRWCLWSSALVSSSIFFWVIHRTIHRSS